MGTYYRITEKASQGIRIQPNFKYTYDDAFFKTEIFENQTFSIYKGKRIMDIVGLNSIGTFAISERLKLFSLTLPNPKFFNITQNTLKTSISFWDANPWQARSQW
jgi:hypothetical protein